MMPEGRMELVSFFYLTGTIWLLTGVALHVVDPVPKWHCEDYSFGDGRARRGERLETHDLAVAMWWACLQTAAVGWAKCLRGDWDCRL
jgi:hypothetical protein